MNHKLVLGHKPLGSDPRLDQTQRPNACNAYIDGDANQCVATFYGLWNHQTLAQMEADTNPTTKAALARAKGYIAAINGYPALELEAAALRAQVAALKAALADYSSLMFAEATAERAGRL